MSAQPAVPTSTLADKQNIDEAIAHCARALEICDSLGISPEIGARLQGVIDGLDQAARAKDSGRGLTAVGPR
jgi:hypothetical protein